MQEMNQQEVNGVSGGVAPALLFFGAALAAGAVVATAAMVYDNATNGNLAGAWYRFTN